MDVSEEEDNVEIRNEHEKVNLTKMGQIKRGQLCIQYIVVYTVYV